MDTADNGKDPVSQRLTEADGVCVCIGMIFLIQKTAGGKKTVLLFTTVATQNPSLTLTSPPTAATNTTTGAAVS